MSVPEITQAILQDHLDLRVANSRGHLANIEQLVSRGKRPAHEEARARELLRLDKAAAEIFRAMRPDIFTISLDTARRAQNARR